ncbi:MAG TPA: PDZ domain-containing protein [Phycisphaerales bacterium]|nr:PDZ domain-containing protein [Phycisphaerales bacterium]HMP36961.1 PDZ domain-containing protein [Phycisphaerales bacterium]
MPPWVVGVGSVLPDPERIARVAISPELLLAARGLDDADWALRDEAARALRASPQPDEELMAILEREPLSVEQRHRLLAILCERLATSPRGALGIRMRQAGDLQPGVLVEGLLPGMPAEAVLRVGDRIVAIDDRPVSTGDGLTSIIQLERPGRTVRLDVLRPQRDEQGRERRNEFGHPVLERVTVELRLGSFDDLERFDDGFGARAAPGRAAMIRSEQVRAAMARYAPAPIEVAVVTAPVDAALYVDDHPAIRSLLLYQQWIDEGSIRVTEVLRRSWLQTLEQLQLAAADPSATEAQRRELEAIASRYAELIPSVGAGGRGRP